MIEVDWNPGTRKLRQFGWIALAGFGVLGTLLAHRLGCFEGQGSWMAPGIVWGFAAACPILGYAFPRALRLVYLAMMAIALPIGLVISTLLLALMFFLMFTPLSLWFKLRGRDELKLRRDVRPSTHWIPVTDQRNPASYFRQF